MVEKGELTVPGIDFELDKLHEECGVFGAYDVDDMMWLHQSIMACLLCSIEVRRAAVLQ